METIFVPEVNLTGQFARIVRADCEIPVIQQNADHWSPVHARGHRRLHQAERQPVAAGAAA